MTLLQRLMQRAEFLLYRAGCIIPDIRIYFRSRKIKPRQSSDGRSLTELAVVPVPARVEEPLVAQGLRDLERLYMQAYALITPALLDQAGQAIEQYRGVVKHPTKIPHRFAVEFFFRGGTMHLIFQVGKTVHLLADGCISDKDRCLCVSAFETALEELVWEMECAERTQKQEAALKKA